MTSFETSRQNPPQRNAEVSHIALDIARSKIPKKLHRLRTQSLTYEKLIRYRPKKLTEFPERLLRKLWQPYKSPTIVHYFKHIRSLRSLYFDMRYFSSDDAQILNHISQGSSSFKHLEEVHLHYWSHDGYSSPFDFSLLTNLFSKLKNLRKLKIILSVNGSFSKKALYEFIQIIQALPSLVAISIEYSHSIYLNSSPGPLIQTLKPLKRLESLSLKFRSCSTDQGIPFIHLSRNRRNFKSLKNVRILFEKCNGFAGGGFNKDLKELSNNLHDLTYLKSFNLTFKKCSNISLINIIRMHKKIFQLKSDCQIKFKANWRTGCFDCFRKCCRSCGRICENVDLRRCCNLPCLFVLIMAIIIIGINVFIPVFASTGSTS